MELDIKVYCADSELDTISRKVLTIQGVDYVIYHCEFYELYGYAPWERFINMEETISYAEMYANLR